MHVFNFCLQAVGYHQLLEIRHDLLLCLQFSKFKCVTSELNAETKPVNISHSDMEDNVSQHWTMQNYKFHGGTVDNMINFELADGHMMTTLTFVRKHLNINCQILIFTVL